MRTLKGIAVIVALFFIMVVILPPASQAITSVASDLINDPGASNAMALIPFGLFLGTFLLMAFVVFWIWPKSRRL